MERGRDVASEWNWSLNPKSSSWVSQNFTSYPSTLSHSYLILSALIIMVGLGLNHACEANKLMQDSSEKIAT